MIRFAMHTSHRPSIPAILLLTLALSLLTLGAPRLEAQEQNFKANRWGNLLSSSDLRFTDIMESLDFYAQRADAKCKELRLISTDSEMHLAQLRLLLLSNYYSPFQYRLISKEIFAMEANIKNKIRDAQELHGIISKYTLIMEEAQNELDTLTTNEDSATNRILAKYSTSIKCSLEKMSVAEAQLDSTMAGIDVLQAKVKSYTDELNNDEMKQTSFFFFGMPTAWYDPGMWSDMPGDVGVWWKLIPATIDEELPDTTAELVTLTLLNILFFGLIYLAGRLVFKFSYFGRGTMEKPKSAIWLLHRGWICLAAALSIFISSHMIDFPEALLEYRLAVILVAAWGMDTAWALKQIVRDTRLPSPLRPLFWLYVTGNVLQAVDIELSLLGLLWPICLFVVALLMRRHAKLPYPHTEQILSTMCALFCWPAIASCVLGYPLLSMFASMLLFTVAIGVQLGMSASAFFVAWVETGHQGSSARELSKAVLVGMGVPLLWLVILSGVAFWASDRLLGINVLAAILTAKATMLGIHLSIISVVAAVFLFFMFKTLYTVLSATIDKMLSKKLEHGVVPSLQTLLYYALGCAYVAILLNVFGVSLLNFAIVAGGLSVGIGFGLQNIINNFISGLIILFGRILKPGDIIEIDGKFARIQKINIRETTAVTKRNAVITIPNTDILNTKITNWTGNGRRARLDLAISVPYGTDLEHACRILLACAAEQPKVLTSPAPAVLLSHFADSAISLELRIWIAEVDDSATPSEVRLSIDRAFRANNIAMPFNQLEVRLLENKPLEG